MNKSKVLIVFVLLCYVLFAILEFSGYESVAYYFRSLIVPIITVAYLFFSKQKNKLFSLFLIFYSLSDILGIVLDNMPYDETGFLYDLEYYIGNGLYILAYTFLIIKIIKSLNLNHIFKYFKMHLIVLTALNCYLLFVMHAIINPNLVLESDYYLELTYNIVILLLLSTSLLNYFYKDNKKSFYLFLGGLFIVFSEVMDIAYNYISQRCFINFISTTLALSAFYFFYEQSKLMNAVNTDGKYVVIEK